MDFDRLIILRLERGRVDIGQLMSSILFICMHSTQTDRQTNKHLLRLSATLARANRLPTTPVTFVSARNQQPSHLHRTDRPTRTYLTDPLPPSESRTPNPDLTSTRRRPNAHWTLSARNQLRLTRPALIRPWVPVAHGAGVLRSLVVRAREVPKACRRFAVIRPPFW